MAADPKSKTELATAALVDAISAVMVDRGFPRPARNATLDVIFETIGESDGAFVNVVDGNSDVTDEMLGADADSAIEGYEIKLEPIIEIVVRAGDPEARDALCDAILRALNDAIITDRMLGGTVDYCKVMSVARNNLATEGVPYVKGVEVTLLLEFTSPYPF